MRVCTVLVLLLLTVKPAFAEFDYHFRGHLLLELGDGTLVPMRNVEVRAVRKGSKPRGVGRRIDRTDDSGRFDFTARFARDRDGILLGRKNIQFQIQGRLRNSDLKVVHGGWFKNNWFVIAERTERIDQGEQSATIDVGNRVIGVDPARTVEVGGRSFIADGGSDLGSWRIKQLANVYWVYDTLRRALEQNGVGIPRRTVVHYPHKTIVKRNSNFYLFDVNLKSTTWDAVSPNDRRTMLHEAMHQWDINHQKGEKSILCLFDAHHKDPDKWSSSRCSGFMEGFAEAVAQRLNQEIFGHNHVELHRMIDLRERSDDYSIRSRAEAERSDDGWQNFLEFIMEEDVWEPFASISDASCQPRHVPVYELLRAIKNAEPRKVSWFFVNHASFEWFTDILVDEVNGFDECDARFYRLLGDPSNQATEIRAEMCSCPTLG